MIMSIKFDDSKRCNFNLPKNHLHSLIVVSWFTFNNSFLCVLKLKWILESFSRQELVIGATFSWKTSSSTSTMRLYALILTEIEKILEKKKNLGEYRYDITTCGFFLFILSMYVTFSWQFDKIKIGLERNSGFLWCRKCARRQVGSCLCVWISVSVSKTHRIHSIYICKKAAREKCAILCARIAHGVWHRRCAFHQLFCIQNQKCIKVRATQQQQQQQ